jgi:hypothetical protein
MATKTNQSKSVKSAKSGKSTSSKAASKKASRAKAAPSEPASVALVQAPSTTSLATPSSSNVKIDIALVVGQAMSQIAAIEAALGPAPALTAADKRHMTKMRKGGVTQAQTIVTIAGQHQVELPSVQLEPIITALDEAAALRPLVSCVTAFAKQLDDMVFQAESTAWSGALQAYGLLKLTAAHDGTLATSLEPVSNFMAYRYPTPRQPGEPTKPQKRALKKSVAKLKKLAPELLVDGTQTSVSAASPAATPSNGSSASNGSTSRS